jgi:hypothetical protein
VHGDLERREEKRSRKIGRETLRLAKNPDEFRKKKRTKHE